MGSLPLRERGLKYLLSANHPPTLQVAPLAGAWVEIFCAFSTSQLPWSLPLRERGLKYHRDGLCTAPAPVAPLAGAWVEII